MGHRARTLAAAVAAIIGIAFAAATGARASSLVRVETPAQSASFNALVNRVVASPSGPVQVIDATSGRPAQCDQASPIAALAAVVPQTDVAYSVAEDGTVGITAIKGTSSAVAPPAAPTWSWAAMADERTVADLCHGTVPEGTEVLVLPRCASPTPVSQPKCFTQGALYVRIGGHSPYAAGPITVAGYKADVAVHGPQGRVPYTASPCRSSQMPSSSRLRRCSSGSCPCRSGETPSSRLPLRATTSSRVSTSADPDST